jgi:hypothetical protein
VAGEGEELILVVIDGPSLAEEDKLAEGLAVISGPKHGWTSWAKRRHDDVPAVSSSRAYQSWVAPVRCMAVYQTRRASVVFCPRKKVSARLSC